MVVTKILSDPHTRPDTKGAAIRRALLRYSDRRIPEVHALLLAEGVRTTVSSVQKIRYTMKAEEGIPLPRLPRGHAKRSTTFTIEEIILRNPGASASQIARLATKQGVHRSKQTVGWVRRRMIQSGKPIRLPSRYKPIPILSQEEYAIYTRALPFVIRQVHRELARRPALQPNVEDIISDISRRLYNWIYNRKPEKDGTFRDFLCMKVQFAVRNWARDQLQQELGLRRAEVRTIFRLIAGQHRGESIEQTAEKYDIPLQEAEELWEAYQTFKGQKPLFAER